MENMYTRQHYIFCISENSSKAFFKGKHMTFRINQLIKGLALVTPKSFSMFKLILGFIHTPEVNSANQCFGPEGPKGMIRFKFFMTLPSQWLKWLA